MDIANRFRRFEGATDKQALARIVERNPRYERAVLRRYVYKAIVREAADSGGNGKSGNSEFFTQSGLVDQTPGLESAGENRFLQFAIHGVRLRMGALRHFPPRRLRASETLRLASLTC